MDSLEFRILDATTVYQDNFGSIYWIEVLQGLRKVKHIGIKYYYVRNDVYRQIVDVKFT